MEEKWVKIFDDDTRFEVSNLGNVRKWDEIAQTYLPVGLYVSKQTHHISLSLKGQTYYLHRIVGTKFVDNPNGYKALMHIDRDKRNNRADNLEWVTYSEVQKSRYTVRDKLKTYILCVETGERFSTMQSTSLITGIPYDIIKSAVHGNKICFGKHYEIRPIESSDDWKTIKHVSKNDFMLASLDEPDFKSWYEKFIKTI